VIGTTIIFPYTVSHNRSRNVDWSKQGLMKMQEQWLSADPVLIRLGNVQSFFVQYITKAKVIRMNCSDRI
jgi:hypothetical protein